MTDERLNKIINRISEVFAMKTTDYKTENFRSNHLQALKQAVATEYAARNNLRYVNRGPVEFIRNEIITLDDIYRKDAAVIKGQNFNLKALREGKKWAYSRYENNCVSCDCMDHPEFFRDHSGRAAMIIAHDYNMPESKDRIEKYAAKNLLTVTFPDIVSWYYPGRTTVVKYVRQGADI